MLLRRIVALGVTLLAAGLLAGPAAAQAYKKHEFPTHGLKLDLARGYEWLAIQPSEEWVVLQWIEPREEDRRGNPSGSGARLQVARIDWKSDPGPSTPGSAPPAPAPEGDGEPEEKPEPPPPPPKPINSWERYLERQLRGWHATPLEGLDDEEDGYTGRAYELRAKEGDGATRGWAYVWENHKVRTFVVLGFCDARFYEEQVDHWERTATKMRFSEPEPDPELVKLERFYKRRPRYLAPEYRIRVRLAMGGDWEAEDTENYIVIYNTSDQPLVRQVLSDLEAIREEYVRLFPPVEPVQAVSTVRICQDRDEYMKYGGPPGSAGYWYHVTEELVLYDGTKREKGKKTDKLDTFIVLYHEAFHQFIHYSVGQFGPHSWFNEGYGDYFSGALIQGGKVKKIKPNRWRLGTIQRLIQTGESIPLADFIHYSKAEYYRRGGQNYAQGWSLIYFLNECREVQRDERWSRILPIYFEELKAAWAELRAGLEARGEEEDDGKVAEAQQAARERAVNRAFEGVDLLELEALWKEFTLSLEL
jgi:hypothetical protein